MSAIHRPTATLPYGAWPSPVSPSLLATSAPGIREAGTNGHDLLWVESRPQEKGRYVLIQLTADGPKDVTPAPWNVRNRVHEYGGGAWTADGDVIVFSHVGDDRLYRIDGPGAGPAAITPEGAFRYADLQLDRAHGRVIAVREDHSTPGREPVNTLVALDLAGPNEDGGRVLVSGSDFVSSPRLNCDRTRIAWITWNHPNMPWDETMLSCATLTTEGTIQDARVVAQGERESVILPGWDEQDRLLFVSDCNGWWHLYRHDGEAAIPLTTGEREYGVPLWGFGESTWTSLDDGTIVAAWTANGAWGLARIEPGDYAIVDLDLPFTSISSVRAHPDGRRVIVSAGTAQAETGLMVVEPDRGAFQQVTPRSGPVLDASYVSSAEPVSWPTPDGATAHGFYYAPRNPEATAPRDELPPLIVESHGGPTGMSTATFDLGVQFWTTRGFAVLDVNYGGSTGHGRAYRERLTGNWGVVDVDDCVSGARYLADQGRVDGDRLVIRGGSAGGFTTLAALAFHDAFRAGVSYYGIGDLEALATDTHKFESRYLDSLVGPYPAAKDVYRNRSPIHHVDRLGSAMILFQGLDDKVVLPSQAMTMADAVRRKGLPVALLTFAGEGHGFRMAETIERTLEAELSFLAQVLGFTPGDDIPRLEIDNLMPR